MRGARLSVAAAALVLGLAAAYLVGAVVGARAALRPPSASAYAAEPLPPPATPAPLGPLLERNPFGLSTAAAPVSAAAAPPPAAPPSRWKCLGVAVAGPLSRALLMDLASSRSDLFRIGEAVGEERLASIEPGRVVLAGPNGRRVLEVGADPGAPPPAPEAAAAPPGGAFGDARLVSRSEIRAAVGGADRVDAILGQARLLPRFVDGRISGFKVEDIREDSLLGEMGIASGDVIVRVNGKNLDSHERGFEIWEAMKGAGEVALEVEREGRPVTLLYRIGE